MSSSLKLQSELNLPSDSATDTKGGVVISPKARFKEPLVSHIFTADPSAHVFDGKLYIYPSHDLEVDVTEGDEGEHFVMTDYHVLSMDDLESPVVDHGQALHVEQVPWAKQQMWAPDAAYRDGTYYLFFPAKDYEGKFRIGVARSSSPTGPFTAEPEPIPGAFSIDPAVFIDEDDQAYLYFGGLWGGQLEHWQTGDYVDDAIEPTSTPAYGPRVARLSRDLLSLEESPQEIQIQDGEGKPLLGSDHERRFFEGVWMHKYNGVYYLSYSTGDTHYLVYATSESPKGPFTYRGRILNPVVGWTTHHSICEFKGKWYLFYHDSTLSGGVTSRRCVKVMELRYNTDGSIQTLDP